MSDVVAENCGVTNLHSIDREVAPVIDGLPSLTLPLLDISFAAAPACVNSLIVDRRRAEV